MNGIYTAKDISFYFINFTLTRNVFRVICQFLQLVQMRTHAHILPIILNVCRTGMRCEKRGQTKSCCAMKWFSNHWKYISHFIPTTFIFFLFTSVKYCYLMLDQGDTFCIWSSTRPYLLCQNKVDLTQLYSILCTYACCMRLHAEKKGLKGREKKIGKRVGSRYEYEVRMCVSHWPQSLFTWFARFSVYIIYVLIPCYTYSYTQFEGNLQNAVCVLYILERGKFRWIERVRCFVGYQSDFLFIFYFFLFWELLEARAVILSSKYRIYECK